MTVTERDRELIQIVDAAMAEAARKSGAWLVCRSGCNECCMGPFPITLLDALRLRDGLAELAVRDPARAADVRQRALHATGAEDEPCPVLDPATGACDLYAARPITCRTFGPAVRCGEDAVGVCELCYQGATDEEIAACEVSVDLDGAEEQILGELGRGETSVASALGGRKSKSKVKSQRSKVKSEE
jgi:Fe-S-cluster containining protein